MTAGLAQGLKYHPIDKPMHVFALSHWSGILASMVKQIMDLGNLIPAKLLPQANCSLFSFLAILLQVERMNLGENE